MGRPGRLSRAPLPAASPGPVPCPPMPAPASWTAVPHRPAQHGPLEAGTWPPLGMRGHGGPTPAHRLPVSQDSSAASLLLPAEPSRGLTGLSPGLDSEMDFWESTVARSCNPDRSAGQRGSGPRPPWPCHHPTYLDPFRACMQGVGPTAPANSHATQAATAVSTWKRQGASARLAPPSLGAVLRKYCCPCPPEAPTHLQKASSAPRSPQGVQMVPASRLPEVSSAQHLLGNLWANHSLPEYWTSPGLGARHRKEGIPWPSPKPR